MKNYFYLSHARGSFDPYLRRFFEDLSDCIGDLEGLTGARPVGFLDARDIDIRLGTREWDASLANALQTSQTLVCLCSPAYLKSTYCGKEWQIFRLRQELFMKRSRVADAPIESVPPFIKPVVWIPFRSDQTPDVVAQTQYIVGDPGAVYNQRGLRDTIKLHANYGAEYNSFLHELATSIVDTVRRFSLPPLEHLPPLAEVESAFRPPGFVGQLLHRQGLKVEAEFLAEEREKSAKDSGGVFISYRRGESTAYAGRLYDRLSARFGGERVFMDMNSIDAGEDFVEAITAAARSCAVMIVLISKQWADASDAAGRRRLDDPDDFVRLEVSTALGRGIRVIPVLIQGATMPGEKELPESLRSLARRQAEEISDTRWMRDVEYLMNTLDRLLPR